MTLNNCTVTIGQYVESQTVETQYVDKQVVAQSETERYSAAGCADDIGGNGQSEMPPRKAAHMTCGGSEERMPNENNYKEVVDWLAEEKAAGRDWYKMNDNNRSAMCRQISNIVGWVVDQNSLRKAGG